MVGKNKVILLILDGFGLRWRKKGNAIKLAKTPNLDQLKKKYPHSKLKASGDAVGLPKGYMGNSEVGHLTIGSGRVVDQDLMKINKSIESNEFYSNHAIIQAIKNVKENNSKMHLMGLLQDQGVHAHQNHLFALMKICTENNIVPYIHILSDGRDTPPKSVSDYIKKLEKTIKKYPAKIASVTGRYYAMDRDNRWDRTKKFYELIVKGITTKKAFKDVKSLIAQAYKDKETDEFIKPRITKDFAKLDSKDSLIFFNYRSDRARQITRALIGKKFRGFNVVKLNITLVSMTRYFKEQDTLIAYERFREKNILARVLKDNKIKQLRIAETEKYAHVTFFFNDEVEAPYKGEERIIVQSPKVATYDLQPEMSAVKVKNELISELNNHDVIICNLANCDMVGHTGFLDATIKAVETVDSCVGEIVAKAKDEFEILIIADHGNAEDMFGKSNTPNTAHTTNKVPCIYIGNKYKKIKSGTLADVAPTILKLLDIDQPKEMTGKSLV